MPTMLQALRDTWWLDGSDVLYIRDLGTKSENAGLLIIGGKDQSAFTVYCGGSFEANMFLMDSPKLGRREFRWDGAGTLVEDGNLPRGAGVVFGAHKWTRDEAPPVYSEFQLGWDDADQAEPAAPKACAGGCGFVVTGVHATHCCNICSFKPGVHGPMCKRLWLEDPESKVSGSASQVPWLIAGACRGNARAAVVQAGVAVAMGTSATISLDGVLSGSLGIPPALMALPHLGALSLCDNQLRELPPSVGVLSSLRVLDLSSNELETPPSSLGGLVALEELRLGRNRLIAFAPLHEIAAHMPHLRELSLACNQLSDQLCSSTGCDFLATWPSSYCCKMCSVKPTSHGFMCHRQPCPAEDAALRWCDLALPALFCSLRWCDLAFNHLHALPPALLQPGVALRALRLDHNPITLPLSLAASFARALMALSLNACGLDTLPPLVMALPALSELSIDDNRLRSLCVPCSRLDMTRLDSTRRDSTPTGLVVTRLDSTRLVFTRLDPTRLVFARLDSTRLALTWTCLALNRLMFTRLDSTRLGSTRLALT